jgi:outer membrane receptor protein involved in Fe transport
MGVYKALLLAGCAGTFAVATPAMAQNAPANADCEVDPLNPACSAPDDGSRIVVTGSRIQRQDFNATTPMVTADEALLDNSSTAAIESNLNKLPQFVPAQTPTAGGDIQPTATNTPGAATISLRGVGANRNLVLVDGRRSTPSNASGVTDISTIPAAAIERVEVISGGASATYGADAVAGVTNFILKKNFQGLELDAQLGLTQEGDGFEYQFSGIMGTDFPDGRGNISLAISMNTREASYQRDRDWYRDLWADPQTGGSGFFSPAVGYIPNTFANAPSGAVLDSIFNQVPAGQPTASQALASFALGNIYVNPDGTVWGGTTFGARGLNYRFDLADNFDGNPWKKTAAGAIAYNNTNTYLILPLTRYNAFARGDYEINDWIGVFGQALFSSVTTYTRNEPGPITQGWDVFVPAGDATYTGDSTRGIASSLNGDGTTNAAYLPGGQYGLNCPAMGGCSISQVFPVGDELTQILMSRPNNDLPFQMVTLMPDDRETFTDVMTYNITAGLNGSIPGMDWTWEAFVNHGESHTFARQTGVYSLERLRYVMTSPNFGQGFSQKGNAASGGFGASTGTCTSGLNFFQKPTGGFSEDCLEAVRADLKNRSKMRQTIAEVNLQGGLFELPAGDLRFALGASYRELEYEFINDTLTTQGRSFLDQALGIYPSGNAYGYIDVKELYGEVLIPVLSDTPFFQELNLEIGGRMSNYNTTGTSYTYKVLGDWAVTDWLRFRGGFNRAERAPNIGELFLSAQQTFGGDNRGDVCSRLNPNDFSANPATNRNGAAGAAQVEAVCRVLMAQSGNPGAADQYYGGVQSTAGGGFAFPTLVGNPNLTPETADTWTAGVVINAPFSSGALSRLRASVDWYDITISDAIGAQTVGAVTQQCYDPDFNPLVATDAVAAANSQFCQLVPRTQTGNTGNVFITYANTGRVHLQGIDVQLDWGADIGPGTLTINSLFNYQINFESSALYPQLPLVDYVGTNGTGENGLNTGVFEYKIFTTIGYGIGPARVALQWQHYPSIQDAGEVVTAGGTPNTAPHPSYNLFNLNANYQLSEDISLRFGVDNLLGKRPPLGGYNPNADNATGQLRMGGFFGQHDTNGRRFYLGANLRF